MQQQALFSRTYWNAALRVAEQRGVASRSLALQVAAIPGQHLPFFYLQQLVTQIKNHSEEADSIGLQIGQRLMLSSHGAMGFAMSNAKNLKQCLDILLAFEDTRTQFMDFTITQYAEYLQLTVIPRFDWQPIALEIYEVILAVILDIVRYVVGDAASDMVIQLPYAPPTWVEQYHMLYPCEYQFSQSQLSLSLSNNCLTIPSISYDEQAFQMAQSQCEYELKAMQSHQPVTLKAINIIANVEQFNITISQLAAQLNMSVSTLIRRLKSENHSFKGIMSDLKSQRARHLLSRSSDSIESIASLLGYSDVSNFNRSCKRWFGCSAAQLRLKLTRSHDQTEGDISLRASRHN